MLKAVDGVSFDVHARRGLGLVGESGSGKSVTGFSILGLIDPPGRIVARLGPARGRELVGLPADANCARCAARRIAMVFQDPMTTLNPVLTIGEQMRLALAAHERDLARPRPATRSIDGAGAGRHPRSRGAGSTPTRISSPAACASASRSRSRCCNRPTLIVCDEPTTALDVSIQAQILAEMRSLARESGTALIWISHDLATVSSIASRILVMYAGRIVEDGADDDGAARAAPPLYARPARFAAGRRAAPGARLAQIPGATPSLLNAATGLRVRAALRRAPMPPAPMAPPLDAGGGRGDCAAIIRSRSDGCRHERARRAARTCSRRGSALARPSLGERIAARFGAADRDRGTVQCGRRSSALTIAQGEVLALVGESGCGKSTLGRMIAGILPPIGRRASASTARR